MRDSNSPNGCWERHGYRVERYSVNPGAPARLRRIYAPTGELVLDGVGYDAEIRFCVDNKLSTDSLEISSYDAACIYCWGKE